MYRNDHPTAGPDGAFQSELAPSQPATVFPADLMTEWQEELANAIEGFGIPLQKGVRNQLFTAIGSAAGPVPTSTKNALINASFEVAQFGSSGTVSATTNAVALGVDRWRVNPGGAGGNVEYQLLGFSGAAGEPPGNPLKFLRLSILGTQAGTGPRLVQRVENALTFANQPVTVSFYARCGSGTLQVGVNLLQNFGASMLASPQVFTSITNVTLTTSWAFYTASLVVPSVAGKTFAGGGDYITLQLQTPDTGTYSMDIWGVQLERGSSPTSFDRRLFSDELLRCMRYRETSLPYGFSAPEIGGGGFEDAPTPPGAMGYQPTPGSVLDGWSIWSLGRSMRVLKREPGSAETGNFLRWHNTISLPTIDSVVVNGVARPCFGAQAKTGHTGVPVVTVNPGAGPSVCEGHWVWADPRI